MPKGSKCDCGAAAETQFAIAHTQKEAKQAAKEAVAARKLGSMAPDVCCGSCMTKKISLKGLVVAEILQFSPIKLDRLPFATKCLDCGKDLPFGVFAYFQAESGCAICTDDASKRGWTDKARAVFGVKIAEAKEDLKAVRKRVKVETEGLYLLEEKVDLHRLAENYIEIEKQILNAVSLVSNFLRAGIGTQKEMQMLTELSSEIKRLQGLQVEIKKELDLRLFLIEKAERQRKMLQKVLDAADAEVEEEQRQAEMAEVSA